MQPMSQKISLTCLISWPVMTLTWQMTTKGLSWYFEVLETRSMPIDWLFLRLKSLNRTAMPARANWPILRVWPDLWRYQWTSGQISHVHLRVHVWGYLTPSRFADRPSSFRDTSWGWGGANPPQTGGVSGQTPTGRGLTNYPIKFYS